MSIGAGIVVGSMWIATAVVVLGYEYLNRKDGGFSAAGVALMLIVVAVASIYLVK